MRLVLISVVLLLALPAWSTSHEPAGFNEDEIPWMDLEAGLAEADRTGRPILLVVHADWCPACRDYRALFFDPRVVAYKDKVVFVLIDMDEDHADARRYQPDGGYVPRTMVLDDEGTLVPGIRTYHEDVAYFLNPDHPAELLFALKRAAALNDPTSDGPLDFNAASIPWQSHESGLKEARETGKPVFLVVHGENCMACGAYGVLFDDEDVLWYSDKLVFVLIDQDETPELADAYAPDGDYLPRTLVLQPDGTHVRGIRGMGRTYQMETGDSWSLLFAMRRAIAWSERTGKAVPSQTD